MNIDKFSPSSGRMLKEDNSVVNMADLFAQFISSSIGVKIPVTVITSTLTRPGDTPGAYSIDDVIAISTSSPDVKILAGVGASNGQSVNITGASLTCSTKQALLPALEIWLFKQTVTPVIYNANFTITDAENDLCVGVLDFTGVWKYSANNSRCDIATINLPVGLDANDVNLYWVPVLKNAYIPAASDSFKLTIKVERQ